jgi:diaminohydroxyphosphoribosylaminopyrimidine deaminase / 5-amino-6-(5-phosphoribosylamino)uracil reductase
LENKMTQSGNISECDNAYMLRCFELASLGLGHVAPNPMVGSVITYNEKIIGEGYHSKYGQAHAEVNAINSVIDKSLLSKSPLYVTLEPCAHFGKTPPCADLIIKNHIPKVVIANIDPFSQVKGKGIEKLKNAGIEVVTGVQKEAGERLNKRFFTFHSKFRPYVILKWAQTQDGFIDVLRTPAHPQQPNWITNRQARMLVHKWRTEEQAIMVGTNTALCDNPRLNVRDWEGNSPVRVLVDRTSRLPQDLHIFDNSVRTLVFTEKVVKKDSENTEFIKIDFSEETPKHIMNELYNRNIQSLIVEGGARLLSSFIKAKLWDESRIFTGNSLFGNGVPAPPIGTNHIWTESWDRYRLDVFEN